MDATYGWRNRFYLNKFKGAAFNQNQKDSYPIAISKGYKMHYFEVNYISFENNEYKIEYKLIKDLNDYSTLINGSLKPRYFPLNGDKK